MRDNYAAVSIGVIVQMRFNRPSSFEIANDSSRFRRIRFAFVINSSLRIFTQIQAGFYYMMVA